MELAQEARRASGGHALGSLASRPIHKIARTICNGAVAADSKRRQWMAAYMIFSSVASKAEYSSTTLPIRLTSTRSDSAMISGR